MKNEKLKKLHNLLINCDSIEELNEYKAVFNHTVKTTSLVGYPVTILSPYYFEASKNDPENKLKGLLTKTMVSKRMEILGG